MARKPPTDQHALSAAHAQARQALLARAETPGQLFERLQKRLERIIADPASKSGDRAQAEAVLSEGRRAIETADETLKRWLDKNLGDSYSMGAGHAIEMARALGGDVKDLSLMNAGTVSRAIADTYGDLAGRTEQISERLTYAIRDKGARVMREAIARGAAPQATARELQDALVKAGLTPGEEFRKLRKQLKDLGASDTNEALRNLVKADKLSAFVDRAGRVWDPGAYTRMACRTKEAILYSEGNKDRLKKNGIHLMQFSSTRGLRCPICLPFQGLIVALDRQTAERVGLPLMTDCLGGPPWHPNCRHSGTGVLEETLQPARLSTAITQASRVEPLLGITDLREFRRKSIAMGYGD